MKQFITTLQFEARHFVKSPFKIISLMLFIGAAIYGLQNGYVLYQKQHEEIQKIQLKDQTTIEEVTSWYDAGQKGPADKPWIDVTTPSWAMRQAPTSVVKDPSLLMPFSIGQAEQFGFYKQVAPGSSVFDADLAAEIANPERLALGTLDFSFVFLYMLPVLAIVLLFNIGGLERDLGFDRLIEVNISSSRRWLAARFGFYYLMVAGVLLALMLVYGGITGALLAMPVNFLSVYLLLISYTFAWFVVFYLINSEGSGSSGQAIQMASLWLLFCVLIPGGLHQYASLKHPANYMTDYLDASREESYALYELPHDSIKRKLVAAYPELAETAHGQDSLTRQAIIYSSFSGLTSKLMKAVALEVEESNASKNQLIRSLSWLSPVTWYHNQINHLSETDYDAYREYRADIQSTIDKKVSQLLIDSWDEEVIDKEKFLKYAEAFNPEED